MILFNKLKDTLTEVIFVIWEEIVLIKYKQLPEINGNFQFSHIKDWGQSRKNRKEEKEDTLLDIWEQRELNKVSK